MKIIKLYERATVERQGEYGWEPETIYEPIYIIAEHIESMNFAGNTILKMVSGKQIIVRETPEEIISLLEAGVAA